MFIKKLFTIYTQIFDKKLLYYILRTVIDTIYEYAVWTGIINLFSTWIKISMKLKDKK